MGNHTPEIIVGIWALMTLLTITMVAVMPFPVYWGGRHGGGQAPMSRGGRIAFVTTLWLMVGVVISGMAGFSHAKVFIAAFLISVILTMVIAAIDTWRWRGRQQRDESQDHS